MFKHSAIKKYGNKLLPALQKRYGMQTYYSASQVRSTVYQCNFKPRYLPLGYLLFIEPVNLIPVMKAEFPNTCINNFKKEMRDYLNQRKYHGALLLLTL